MKLSLVMPVYNAASTVERAIESFLALSREGVGCTLWVVDDCSTDGSLALVEAVARGRNSIRVIKNAVNLGPGLSRNKALEHIHEGYIGFLDADDEIVPQGYAASLAAGYEVGADFITCNGWTQRGNKFEQRYDFDRVVDNTASLATKCIRGELDGSVIFSIYSEKLIHENGLRFPAGYYEDIPFAYAGMLLASRRHISTTYSYQKNHTEGSILNTITRAHIDGLLTSCFAIRGFVRSHQLASYDEFEMDFSFGARGYIAHALTAIILNGASTNDKIALLSYLHECIREYQDLDQLKLRAVTKKDRLVAFYYQGFRKSCGMGNPTHVLMELMSFYQGLFGVAE